jgi:hypothetical protein
VVWKYLTKAIEAKNVAQADFYRIVDFFAALKKTCFCIKYKQCLQALLLEKHILTKRGREKQKCRNH